MTAFIPKSRLKEKSYVFVYFRSIQMTVLSLNWENLKVNVGKMGLFLCKEANFLKWDLPTPRQNEFRDVGMKEFTPLRKKCEDLRTNKMSETLDTQNTIQTTRDSILTVQSKVIIWKIQSFTRVWSKIWGLREVTRTQTVCDIFRLIGIRSKIDQIQVSDWRDYRQWTWRWSWETKTVKEGKFIQATTKGTKWGIEFVQITNLWTRFRTSSMTWTLRLTGK